MAVNLKNVFSQQTYDDLNDYFYNGKDAISMLGYGNAEVFYPNEIVTRFQTLADPDFINEVRSSWGNLSSSTPFQMLENVPPYMQNKFNNFALKSRFLQNGKLKFPLVGSYKNINQNYFDNNDCKNFDAILNLFEENLNIKIVDAKKSKKLIESKGGKLNYCGNTVTSLTKNLKKFKNKVFRLNVPEQEQSYFSNSDFAKPKIKMATKIAGQDIQNTDKVVALVNYLSEKSIFQVAKKHKKFIKQFKPSNIKQIALISQILTDIFVCQALDLGTQTNKKVDNALKLQLSNQIALSNLSPNELELASRMAEVATGVLLKKLKLPIANIAKTRENMGTFYKEEPQNFYDVLFGETQKQDFAKVGNDIFYIGESKFLNQFATQEQDQTLNFVPNNKPEFENENELFESTLTPTNLQPQNFAEKANKSELDDLFETQKTENFEEQTLTDDDLFETPIQEQIEENVLTDADLFENQTETEKPLLESNQSKNNFESEEDFDNFLLQPVEPNQTEPTHDNYLDLTEEINKYETPRSFDNYLNLTKQIEKAEKGRSFEDYLNLSEEIDKAEKVRSFDDYLQIKESINQKQPQKNTSTQPDFESTEKKSYKRELASTQKTFNDFLPKKVENINFVKPTAQKSEPKIIYIQPLDIGKIDQPLPHKAIIKSNKITYKQAETAIQKIISTFVENILKEKEQQTKKNAVKLENKIENQISKLTVKQMQEIVVALEKFKVETLNSIFNGKEFLTKEECGVKSASALINKEPKERHTLLKSDVKKIILEQLKQIQAQEIKQDNSHTIIKNQVNKTKKECLEENEISFVSTQNTNIKKDQTQTKAKFETKKQLETQKVFKKQQPVILNKPKPIKVVRQIRCTRCPLGVSINVKNAKTKASSKNLE
ncbi:MAG: hypothetical protein PHQ62_02190 [Clostridia bacterium]|nr:hypothetical protein [Clostridia bacterium]